jgi:molybdopterin/thiamine biosynthesis adenylyltransferase
VEFAYCKDPRGIVTVRFIARDGTVLRRVPFSSTIVSHGQTFKGQWIILPNITVVRHRPPQTYNELFTICRPYDPAITQALRRAWAMGSKTEKFGVLLVGVPIPQYVAEQPSEIHWQPIVFTNKEVEKRKFRGKGKADEGRLWQQALNGCFKRGSPVLWTKSANLDHSRQYARGSLPSPTKDLTIAIIGCGALGSIVAEALARSGIRRLFLFDGDSVEFGNLNRHTLDGRHVGLNKATALARRLASANPLSTINGYNTNIPIPTSSDERSHRALHEADVIVDCSTDHGAFLWLSRYARSTRKRLASMFIDAHATLLTLVLSGQHTPCNKVFERLNDSIQAGTTPVLSDDYFGKPKDDESILPGAGCWHPTFPAHNRHIWILGCTAIDLLISWMQRPYRCDGHGILIRRSGTEAAGPSVEILWNEPYR